MIPNGPLNGVQMDPRMDLMANIWDIMNITRRTLRVFCKSYEHYEYYEHCEYYEYYEYYKYSSRFAMPAGHGIISAHMARRCVHTLDGAKSNRVWGP